MTKITDKDIQDYIKRFNDLRNNTSQYDAENYIVRRYNSLLVEILSHLSTGRKQQIPLLLISNPDDNKE